MTWWGDMVELRDRLNALAEIDWRHPAWWASIAATALAEQLDRGHPGDDYLGTDGSPRFDTFVARDMPGEDASARVRTAVVRARAAVAVLDALDGTYPEQPLKCHLDRTGGWVRRAPIRDRTVAFATPHGVWEVAVADLGDGSLKTALSGALLGDVPSAIMRPLDSDRPEPCQAAAVISLCHEQTAWARHIHRRAWTRGGGPWLGIGEADGRVCVSTCHLVVDGYGHMRVATEILDRAPLRGGFAMADSHSTSSRAPREVAPPLGIATRVLEYDVRFAAIVYAAGRVVDRFYPSTGSHFTPTLQIPVAPGDRSDPSRRKRRVLPGLISLRRGGGELESFAQLRARLPDLLASETAGRGVLSRMRAAASALPIPIRVKRKLLASAATPSPRNPLTEVLSGRCCVSVVRFPPDEEPASPLFAVSAPALEAAPRDPAGGTVLTVVRYTGGVAVTVSGTGIAATAEGAERFLDWWVAELEALEGVTSKARIPALTLR